MTQEQLADDANVAVKTIVRYEQGRETPRVSSALRLAAALHVPIVALFPPLARWHADYVRGVSYDG